MEVLLVEDLTFNCDTYNDVHEKFENNIQAALDVLRASNVEAEIKVQQFLANTTIVTPTTTTPKEETTTYTSTSLDSTPMTSTSTEPATTTLNKTYLDFLDYRLYSLIVFLLVFSFL